MSFLKSELRTITDAIVQDAASLIISPGDLDVFIDQAVEMYSEDRTRTKTQDVVGSGLAQVDMPSDWVRDFSVIESIEFPIGNIPRDLLEDEEEFETEDIPDGAGGEKTIIRFLESIPKTTESFRLKITVPHVLSVDTVANTTIASTDKLTLGNLSASRTFLSLSAALTQTSDSSIGADAVDFIGRAAQYQALAAEHERIYKEKLGKTGEGRTVAVRIPEIDVRPTTGGRRFWFQNRREAR